MDVRSAALQIQTDRVGSRIEALNENEQGFLHVKNMTQGRKIFFSHGGRELFLLFHQATIEA
jgi:hypothetical protein